MWPSAEPRACDEVMDEQEHRFAHEPLSERLDERGKPPHLAFPARSLLLRAEAGRVSHNATRRSARLPAC